MPQFVPTSTCAEKSKQVDLGLINNRIDKYERVNTENLDFPLNANTLNDIIYSQGWQCNKTRLEKNRFLLPGFFGFFQMDFEKTRVF